MYYYLDKRYDDLPELDSFNDGERHVLECIFGFALFTLVDRQRHVEHVENRDRACLRLLSLQRQGGRVGMYAKRRLDKQDVWTPGYWLAFINVDMAQRLSICYDDELPPLNLGEIKTWNRTKNKKR